MKRETTLLLDANLLVLLVVGATSKTLIPKHKKTKLFTPVDFDRLVAILGDRRVLILPHIGAEASNLVQFRGGPDRASLVATLGAMMRGMDEA